MDQNQPPPEIVVIGSVNMDLVVRAPRIPAPGETILGGQFQMIPGGKGANQAVAAARLGGKVAFVGRVGDDEFGRVLRANLESAGVDCRFLKTTPDAPTGVALIVVSETGENAICVAGGANRLLTPADIAETEDNLLRRISTTRVCVLQFEIPLETVHYAVDIAWIYGMEEIILDPAPVPVQILPEQFGASIWTPNQSEAAQLLSLSEKGIEPHKIAARLRERTKGGAIVLKLGSQGAYLLNDSYDQHLPGYHVNVVDTTAAGDAFTAALAVARAEKKPFPDAVRFANAAGALACTRFGAQPSLPMRAEVEALLAS